MIKIKQSNLDYFDKELDLWVIRYYVDEKLKSIPLQIIFIDEHKIHHKLTLCCADKTIMEDYALYDCRYE